jgi:sugar phosphate isomerase/epimerase
MSKLALNEITTFRASLLDDVTACQDMGITGIGLWRRKITDFGDERTVELLRDSGLHVTSLSWAGGFTGSYGLSFDEAVDDARAALQLGRNLNADCLAIVTGTRNNHTANYARKLVVDGLRQLADDAGEAGIALALQPVHRIFQDDWSFVSSLDEALELLLACRHSAVKIALDVYHMAQEPDLLARLPQLVPHLAVVQLSDGEFPPADQYDRRHLGDGDIPLADITQTLVDSGYTGYFELALWSRTLWKAESSHVVSECLERFERHCWR